MRSFKLFSLQRSIFTKFSLSFILVGLIPLSALGYLLLGAFSDQVERYTANNLEQMMLYMSHNIEQSFTGYNEITKLMYVNSDRYDALLNVLQKRDDELTLSEKQVVDDFLKTILATDRHIQNAFFVRYSDGKIQEEHKQQSKVFDASSFPPPNWLPAAAANIRELVFLPTHRETYYYRSDRQVMTFARNFFDTSTTLLPHPQVLGTLYFDVDVGVFDDLFADIRLGAGDEVTLVNSDKSVIYSNVKSMIGTTERDGDAADAKKDFFMQKSIPSAGQVFKGRFSKQSLLSSISQIKGYLAIVVIGCIVSLIAMSLAFSRRFSQPIRGIIKVMAKVESGNLDIQVPVRSEDELGQLAHGFNRMTSRLGTFIHEAYVAKIERKQAELNALKSQIRPHYLYNTLEVIRMSAVASDAMPVADMIHSLSNQLKYVLDYGEDIVSIREELGHLDDYFRLIRIRFEDTIELETVVGPDISPDWGMLKLAVQTLVENAVQHGIRPKGGRGKIRVSIEKAEGDQLALTVFDNGVGMTESKLQEVQMWLEGTAPEELRKHVGLKNVHDRLQSRFGEGYGLVLNSRPYVGTSVMFKMPIIRGGDASC